MSRAQMPLYDPEDPRWDAWRRDQRRARMEDAFYREHYRYGERGVLARYIIAPRGAGSLLEHGWTVGDTLLALAALAVAYGWMVLMLAAFGPGAY